MASPAYNSILLLYTYFACLAWNFYVILLSNLYHIVSTLYPLETWTKMSDNPTSSTNNAEPLFSRRKETSSSAAPPSANSCPSSYSSFYYDFYHFSTACSR